MSALPEVPEEFSRLLAPTRGDEFLSQDLLHNRPLSAHLFSGISFVGTSLYQGASQNSWHGHIVRALADVVYATGFLFNSALAGAETVGALGTALLLSTVHTVTGARSEILQKHSVRAWSYATQSVAILIIQIGCVYYRAFSEYHTLNWLAQHGSYVLSAAGSQLVGGMIFDFIASRDPSFAAIRSARVFIESGYEGLIDLLHALDSDIGVVHSVRDLANHASFQNFFAQYPAHQTLLQGIGIGNLQDPAYRDRVRTMITDYLQFSHIAHPVANNPTQFVFNNNSQQETDYQQKLKGHIKAAFKEIHASDTLAGYLGEEGSAQNGKEALEGFYNTIYQPLAYIAQLKELEEQEMSCPVQFTNRKLQQYNGRREQIIEAQKLLSKLSSDEKTALVRKLIQGSSFTQSVQAIEDLYKKIGELAVSLHQGTLMIQWTFDIANQDMSTQNLFQQACMEAAQEI